MNKKNTERDPFFRPKEKSKENKSHSVILYLHKWPTDNSVPIDSSL